MTREQREVFDKVVEFFEEKLNKVCTEPPFDFEMEKLVPGYKKEWCFTGYDSIEEELNAETADKVYELARLLATGHFVSAYR